MRRILLLGAILALLSACAPQIQDPGPHVRNPMPPRLTETHYVTRDGTQLPIRRWTPDTTPRGVLLALHGFNDHSNAFAEFGPWMARHGITTIAYDQRGFGTSQQKGLWPGHDVLADDAAGALAAIADAYPGIPVHALGESMGGAVLLAANDRAPLAADGLILVAPAVWGRATIPAYQTATLWVFAHTLPWLTLSGQGIKRNPSDNIEMLRALGRDPLVIRNTRVDSLWGIVNLMDAAQAAAARLETPALLLFGANDDIIPPEAARRMLDTLPESPARERQIAVYENGYHMLLRDLQAATVWTDVLAWMDSPGTPLPSGADRSDPGEKLPGR